MDPRQDADHLYQALKTHTPRVRRDVRLASPPALSVAVSSPLCGSQLTLDALIRDGRVDALGYRVRACALGQASTAIVLQHVPGLGQAEILRVREQLRQLLQQGEGHCDWPEFEVFALAHAMPARHAAALLPLDALAQLFTLADGNQAGTTPGSK
ncbi:iron-sulfur cluster assembly scaffold protein [Lysobacteraceae bacterium NML07-0707]|nr:iron-sulfur cluster assembly scaffold protein [Xanthomonadaceae bacterium NML07-0707]